MRELLLLFFSPLVLFLRNPLTGANKTSHYGFFSFHCIRQIVFRIFYYYNEMKKTRKTIRSAKPVQFDREGLNFPVLWDGDTEADEKL